MDYSGRVTTATFGFREARAALDLDLSAATALCRAAEGLGLGTVGPGNRRRFTAGQLVTIYVVDQASIRGDMRAYLYDCLPDVLDHTGDGWLAWWRPDDLADPYAFETASTLEGLLDLIDPTDLVHVTIVDLTSLWAMFHDRLSAL